MRAALALAALAAAACAVDAEPAAERGAIMYGDPAPDDDAVGLLYFAQSGAGWYMCTGTLISPRVVLTAAHCGVELDPTGAYGRVSFKPIVTLPLSSPYVGVDDHLVHPDYDGDVAHGDDLALLLLDTPQEVTPVPLNRRPLDATRLRAPLRLLGYGRTEGEVAFNPSRIRRTVTLPLAQYTGELLFTDQETGGQCHGDSGGPVLHARDGVETVHGVISWGYDKPDGTCVEGTYAASVRVDKYVDWIDAWVRERDTVTCAGGDYCADGCALLDPDCEPACRENGACVDGCFDVDPDCPVRQLGERCAQPGQCAGGRCEPAADEPALSFCTADCSEAAPCPAGMVCGAAGACAYDGPTPGALGGVCAESTDCVSALCVQSGEARVCTTLCAPEAEDACPVGYECSPATGGASICLAARPGEGGGGCAIAARRRGGAGALLALLLLTLEISYTRRRHGRRAG